MALIKALQWTRNEEDVDEHKFYLDKGFVANIEEMRRMMTKVV